MKPKNISSRYSTLFSVALNNNEDLAIIRSKLKPMLAGAGIIPTEDMFNLGTKPGSPKSLVQPGEGGNNEVLKQFSTVPPRPASDDYDESDGKEEDDEIHQQPPPVKNVNTIGYFIQKNRVKLKKYYCRQESIDDMLFGSRTITNSVKMSTNVF